MANFELIDVPEINVTKHDVSSVLKNQIRQIVLSGMYSEIKTSPYEDVIKCLVRHDLVDFQIFHGALPVFAILSRPTPKSKLKVTVDIHAADPSFNPESTDITISPKLLADILLYSAVLVKSAQSFITNSHKLANDLYIPMCDIYTSLIFFMLKKEYGLMELKPKEAGIMRLLFSKYVAQSWFGIESKQATFSFAIQSVFSARVIPQDERIQFIEEVKRLKLDEFDATKISNIINYIRETRIIPDIDMTKFRRIIYMKHELYSIVAFERPWYFLATCLSARFTRKIPISSYFAAVNKTALRNLISSTNKVIMGVPVIGDC